MERDQIEKKRKFNVYNINTEKRQPKVPIKYRFPVDYNDCFETPMIAYQDISIVIDLMAKSLGKSRNSIILYDPYYCQGNTIKYLNQLGFPNVINRNSDFYDDIKKNEIPEYDIMITNPPFSGEHKAKLLKYIGGINKPFAILLPLYTATKAYWRAFVDFTSSISPLKSSLIEFPSGSPSQRDVQSHNKDKSSYNKKSNKISNVSNISDKTNEKVKPVADVVTYITYILPPDNYEYTHPEGTGKDQPPFYSSWFVGTGPCCDPTVRVNLNPARISHALMYSDKVAVGECLSAPSSSLPTHTLSTPHQKSNLSIASFQRSRTDMHAHRAPCSVAATITELIGLGLVTDKRANPKARKRQLNRLASSSPGLARDPSESYATKSTDKFKSK